MSVVSYIHPYLQVAEFFIENGVQRRHVDRSLAKTVSPLTVSQNLADLTRVEKLPLWRIQSALSEVNGVLYKGKKRACFLIKMSKKFFCIIRSYLHVFFNFCIFYELFKEIRELGSCSKN